MFYAQRPFQTCGPYFDFHSEDRTMLGWAVTFLIVALIAGVLGFGGVAIVSVEIAKTIFVIAIILFLVSAIFGFVRGRSTGAP
jgi:uncharacterized membrane protein YtjA (UPF0391 family)